MIEYIQANPVATDTKAVSQVTKVQIATKIQPTDAKECTADEALAEVKKNIPIDSKTSLPIEVKYYHHTCYHDAKNPSACKLVEIDPNKPVAVSINAEELEP
jgi:hypothetical protein